MLTSWGEPSPTRLESVLATAVDQTPTYPELGATQHDVMPAGYRHDDLRVELGRGDEVTARARLGIETWRAHTGAGLAVYPTGAPVEVGGTVLVVATVGPLRVVAPCRIIAVVDEPSRFGFAYGTLPGHPEQGEEAFVCEQSADGTVIFRVRAFSRPRDPLARLGAPVSRWVQTRATRSYLKALQQFVRRGLRG
jgi:uncharacterized protein (UPF0548 family)